VTTRNLSVAAASLLESIVKNEGDVVISPEQALEICGTTSRIRVKDMSDRQLLQYALLSTYGIAQRLAKAFEEAQHHAQLQMALQGAESPQRASRAQRRAQERQRAKMRAQALRMAKEQPALRTDPEDDGTTDRPDKPEDDA
jgi:hypothetical protein